MRDFNGGGQLTTKEASEDEVEEYLERIKFNDILEERD